METEIREKEAVLKRWRVKEYRLHVANMEIECDCPWQGHKSTDLDTCWGKTMGNAKPTIDWNHIESLI